MQQQNAVDCGFFMLELIKRIMTGKDIKEFSSEDIPNIRRKMFLELIKSQIENFEALPQKESDYGRKKRREVVRKKEEEMSKKMQKFEN